MPAFKKVMKRKMGPVQPVQLEDTSKMGGGGRRQSPGVLKKKKK